MSWGWLLAAAVLVALVVLYLGMTAGRLDRLHRRIDTGSAALDIQLLRRSGAVLELVGLGLLDPATSAVLADAAHATRAAPEGDPVGRGLAESDLTRALAAALPDAQEVEALAEEPAAADLLDELAGICRRVELSRRFLNDGVRACRQVRRQRFVRWFRLAGRTPWPQTLEMDDTPPPGLTGR